MSVGRLGLANQTLERIGVGRCRFIVLSFPSFTSLFETGLPADLSACRWGISLA